MEPAGPGSAGAAQGDGGGLHRLDDPLVAGTAAEYCREALADLDLGRPGIGPKQIQRRQQHPRRAEAALQAVVLVEGLLQRMQLAVLHQPLHRHELRPVRLHREHQAGAGRQAVDEHGAGAADAVLATDVGPGEAQVLAQEVHEELARLAAPLPPLTIDGELDGDEVGHSAVSHSRLRPAQGAAGEHARQVATVGGRGVDVGVGLDQLGRPARRRLEGGLREPVALEDLLGGPEPDWHGPRARRREAGCRAALSVSGEHRGDADDGEVAVAAAELLEREAGAGGHGGQPHLDEDLVRPEARGEIAPEQLGWAERPLATRPPDHDRSVQCREDRRVLGRWIGVGEAAPDGPAGADRQVPHEGGRFGQERQPPPYDGRELDGALAGHGAQADYAVLFPDVRQARDRVQVDERGGPAQAEVEERHQALPPGQELGLAAVTREKRHRVLDGRGGVVVEGYRLHGCPRLLDWRALWITSQSRVGDMGSSVIRTPRGPSASLTAFAITAGTVIELDSPSPLEPSGVSGEGETTCAMSMTGASEAVGTR